MRNLIPKTLFEKIALLLIIMGISLPLFNNSVFPDKVKRCGKVIDKMVIPKHKSSTDLVFLVQFDNKYESVDVDRVTYMRFHSGDNVCFMMAPEVSIIAGLKILYVMAAWFCLCVYIIWSLSEKNNY